MTAITFYSDDKSILQKLLDLALQLNIKTQIQPIEVENNDLIMAAITEMDNQVHYEVSMDELYELIHN